MKRRIPFVVGVIAITIIAVISSFYPKSVKKMTGLAINGISISCDKVELYPNETTTCNINAVINSGEATSFTGNIVLSNNLTLVSSKFSSSWSQDFSTAQNGRFVLSTGESIKNNINVGSIVIKAGEDVPSTGDISMQDVVIGDENHNDVPFQNGYKSIKISPKPIVTIFSATTLKPISLLSIGTKSTSFDALSTAIKSAFTDITLSPFLSIPITILPSPFLLATCATYEAFFLLILNTPFSSSLIRS